MQSHEDGCAVLLAQFAVGSGTHATRNHSCFSTGFDIPARVLGADSALNASQHVLGQTDTVL